VTLLIATAGCVSVPAGGPVRAPVLAPDGRTVAPVWPSPAVTPRQEQPREQLVTVRGLPEKPVRSPKAGTARGVRPVRAVPARRRERPPRRVWPSGARAAVRSPAPAHTVRRDRHGVPVLPWPRASADAGAVCRMASGQVRGELLRICRQMFGG
jgi:hypothetical protein